MEKGLLGQYIDMQEERRDLERRIRRMGAKLAVHTEAAAQAEKEMEEAKERLDSLLLELERDIQKVENSRINRRGSRENFMDSSSWLSAAGPSVPGAQGRRLQKWPGSTCLTPQHDGRQALTLS